MVISSWLVVAVLQTSMFILIFLTHQPDQSLPNSALSLSTPYALSKAAGIALHINLIVLLLPNCSSLRWIIRKTVGRLTKLKYEATTQLIVASSLLVFALVHAGGRWAIFAQLSIQESLGPKGFALLNFGTGVGWSGHAMLVVLALIITTAGLRPKASVYPCILRCQNTFRGLFLGLWAAHEAFCVPGWSFNTFATGSDVFWRFWVAGAVVYTVERMLLIGLRSTQKVRCMGALLSPSDVNVLLTHRTNTLVTGSDHQGHTTPKCCLRGSIRKTSPQTNRWAG